MSRKDSSLRHERVLARHYNEENATLVLYYQYRPSLYNAASLQDEIKEAERAFRDILFGLMIPIKRVRGRDLERRVMRYLHEAQNLYPLIKDIHWKLDSLVEINQPTH